MRSVVRVGRPEPNKRATNALVTENKSFQFPKIAEQMDIALCRAPSSCYIFSQVFTSIGAKNGSDDRVHPMAPLTTPSPCWDKSTQTDVQTDKIRTMDPLENLPEMTVIITADAMQY